MSAKIIDTPSGDYFYAEQVNLDGATYTIGFYWNVRASAWFFDIDDPSGNPIVHGLRVTAGRILLRQSVNPAQPPGQFYIYDTSGGDVDPGINDLGTRVLVVYIPITDSTAIGAA